MSVDQEIQTLLKEKKDLLENFSAFVTDHKSIYTDFIKSHNKRFDTEKVTFNKKLSIVNNKLSCLLQHNTSKTIKSTKHKGGIR